MKEKEKPSFMWRHLRQCQEFNSSATFASTLETHTSSLLIITQARMAFVWTRNEIPKCFILTLNETILIYDDF